VRRRCARLGTATAVALFAGSSLTACAADVTLARPDCGTAQLSTLTLMAQSVRDATLVPCLRGMPAGWSFVGLDVRQNRSRITLASDRAGKHALEVALTHTCDTSGAVRIPSDEPQTERYETVDRVSPDYLGTRAYVFDGGCVTYRFDLHIQRPSVLINEVTLMVGFTTRTELRDELRRDSHGVIENGP
jgi:hypothetical protein